MLNAAWHPISPICARCGLNTKPATTRTEDIDEVFYLKRFPQPFGGYRWYFICPTSNRHCRVLYQPPGAKRFRSRWGFRCRLQYQSQRLAPQFRYQHGATQAAKRVLNKGQPEWQEEYADWEFPPKPPWMRWKTYNRLDERAQAYEKAADAQFVWSLRRFLLPGENVADMAERMFPGSTKGRRGLA